MRDIVLSVLFPVAFIWALSSAPASILVLNWIWFQRPYDFSWGIWNTMPMFLIALAIAVLSNVIRGQFKPRIPGILFVYFLFLAWITLSAMNAFRPARAWELYWTYLPSMWVAPLVLFATIRELDLLKKVIWVAAGGIGLNAFKVGVVLTAKGGGYIQDQISGFVGDNNVFALVLCLVAAILIGLRSTIPKRFGLPRLFYFAIAMILMCIIYTKSRGALLSIGVIAAAATFLSGRPIRGLVLSAAMIAIAVWVVPAQYFDRLSTINNLEADTSAVGRFENWQLSWDEALEHPIFGVGPGNHLPYNQAIQSEVQVRVAHNVYLQILGELGFPALLLYLMFMAIGSFSLFSTWRIMRGVVEQHRDLTWVRDLSFWMFCGLIGYSVGAGLLNMLYIEFPWYAVMYGAMLRPLVKAELAKRGIASPKAGRALRVPQRTPERVATGTSVS